MADAPPTIRSVPRGRLVRNPLSIVRVDTAIARSAAGFGFAFMLQSLPAMFAQLPNMRDAWSLVIVPSLFVALVLTAVASAMRYRVRAAHITFALVYLVALVTWPFAVIDPAAAPKESYWLYYLLTVATAMATVGMRVRVATAYLILVPTLYAIIRVTPWGGGVTVEQAALDSVYSIILGGAITVLTAILRGAASTVDRAQSTALERYGHAVREHAMEAERVHVDAIVHDGVLTTLLSAARAQTAEDKEIAARMAGDAIGYLRDAVADEPSSDEDISVAVLATRIADAASAMSSTVRTDAREARDAEVPFAVADALYSAAVQALVNSLQHAGDDVRRWVRVGARDGVVMVEVGDNGVGFDLHAVPTGRLGVRVSILERVTSVGGCVDITTSPGGGTVVTLHWSEEAP
ncbi:sensor histidine kinase [Salinibacterium sp. ZJ70]|uniref:sensor histidine kinase n=1 Tax=Salinibacterium sp. ZJ70 TaxID=2708084 RepID=UPI00141DA71F|nr:ATP-binding protein [Salinibacterium sp. ZJ70]